jgi:hypothetical protein
MQYRFQGLDGFVALAVKFSTSALLVNLEFGGYVAFHHLQRNSVSKSNKGFSTRHHRGRNEMMP